MAPGRKQKHAKSTRPANAYVHPSLSPSGASTASNEQEQSVSERLEYLRRVQTPRLPRHDMDHPSIGTLARVPDQARNGSRVAGPKPPKSWTEGSLSFKHGSSSGYAHERRPARLDYFPGIEWPAPTSLLHQATKALAMNFEWHREYDHFYLSTLPVDQKNLLLRYIARYGPYDGIEVNELRLLFSSQHEIGLISTSDDFLSNLESTGSEELDCLDLGGSIGRRGQLKQLDKYWTRKPESTSRTPDEWDQNGDDVSIAAPSPGISSSLRFPSLVKLSLAYPGRNVSWTDLLHFSRHLGALTHLSLARWPIPRNSSTIISDGNSSSIRGISFAAATAELDDAIDALRLFSRNTPSLTHLSLAGCETWYHVLRHVSITSPAYPAPRLAARRIVREFGGDGSRDGTASTAPSERFIDFASGPWRRLAQLDLTQASLPTHVDPRFLAAARERRSWTWGAQYRRPDVELQGLSATQLSAAGWQRHLGLRSGRGVPTYWEQYQIVTPDLGVAESMKQKERMRAWCDRECDALDVGWFIQALRVMAEGKSIDVVYGWGKQELLDAGYDEAELFGVGL